MKLVSLGGWLAVLGAGAAAGIAVQQVRTSRSSAAAAQVYQASFRSPKSTQMVLVYVGKKHCSWSNQPQMPGLVEMAKKAVAARARKEGISMMTTGIALDWSTADGLAHLSKFGNFEEISAGNNWGNTLALKYLWGEFGGEAATPQLFVVVRQYADSQPAANAYQLLSENVVVRKVGLREIEQWAAQGYPVPVRYTP